VFRFRALASGSSGNAYLLQTARSAILIEAGLPINKIERYLVAEDVHPERLSAILISHEHRDHCASARDLAIRYGTPVIANADVLRAAGIHDCTTAEVLDVGKPLRIGDVEIVTFPVSHDSVRPVGFRLTTDNRTITIATDLGDPGPEVIEAIAVGDLVVLEANHDLEMLVRGRYPHYLKQRVAGTKGHLSNDQAARVLSSYLKSDSVEVWLAHLSKHNNTPALAQRTVQRALRSAGLAALSLGVLHRDRPSLRWNGRERPRQLALFPSLEPA
jgi:phosphoribosyl 1,2-cyclic phosphodiesterase